MDAAEAMQRHFADCARSAGRMDRLVFTDFLDPSQAELARRAAEGQHVPVAFYGGHDDAERVVAAFGWTDSPEAISWPLAALRADWDGRFAACEHRDILGALMALGVERECFGDILIDAGNARAFLFVLENMESFIISELKSAGRAALRLSRAESVSELPPQGEYRRVTVQSPRLDAVMAAAFNVSRAEAQRMVRSGRVRVSFVECLNADRQLAAGDIVSARGLGRFKLIAEQGRTRRDRLGLGIFTFKGK